MNKFLDKTGVDKLVSWIKTSLKTKANDADLANSLMVDLIEPLSKTSTEYDIDIGIAAMLCGMTSNFWALISPINMNRIYHTVDGIEVTTEEFPTFETVSQWESFQSIGTYKSNELLYLLPSNSQQTNCIAGYGIYGKQTWMKINLPVSDCWHCMGIGNINAVKQIVLVGQNYALYSDDGYTFYQFERELPSVIPWDDFSETLSLDPEAKIFTYTPSIVAMANLQNTNMWVMVDKNGYLLITDNFEKYKVDTDIQRNDKPTDVIATNYKIYAVTESNKLYYSSDGLVWDSKEIIDFPAGKASKKIGGKRIPASNYYIAVQNSSEIYVLSDSDRFEKETLPMPVDLSQNIFEYGMLKLIGGQKNNALIIKPTMYNESLIMFKADYDDKEWRAYTFYPHLKSGMSMIDHMPELINMDTITNSEIDAIFESSN